MQAKEIIRKKRDAVALSYEEIEFLIKGYLKNEVPDYQMSAFLMASYLRGLSEEETISLTKAMLHSGEVLDLKEMDMPVVDKHSTGGVGDKVSIVLAPLVACADVVVPMIAGRGLGHTGGTIDKLEAIPGFKTEISMIEFRNNLWEVGTAIVAQSERIAPADRKLYSLRDATETIDSIPLITSSILSKKLAEGLHALVLDVKCGSGAFMKDQTRAEALAETLVRIGNSLGVKTVAVVTDMEEPLGSAVGNALEIKECISILKGRGDDRLVDLILTLGAWMLYVADEWLKATEDMGVFVVKEDLDFDEEKFNEKKEKLRGHLNSGDAMKKFVEMVEAQGGNPEIIVNPSLLPTATKMKTIEAPKDGHIHRADAFRIGYGSMLLGAGRAKIGEEIDHSVGVVVLKKSGQSVQKGEPLCVIHYNDDQKLQKALPWIEGAFVIEESQPEQRELFRRVII